MRNVKLLLIGLLVAAVYAMAGGTASFVAKKSKTGEFAFSEATQQAFLKDCSANANEWVCGCVLGQLQGSYGEKEYLKLDADLRKGHENYDFTEFLSKAVAECDEEYETAASRITEEDARAYVEKWMKTVKKKDFISSVPFESLAFYGKKDGEKVLGCVYDRLVKDKKRFEQVIMEEGYPGDVERWGIDYFVECVPEKLTPEMKKNFIKYMNQNGVPKSMAQCILNTFEREYSLKSFVASAKKGEDMFILVMTMLASKCLVE